MAVFSHRTTLRSARAFDALVLPFPHTLLWSQFLKAKDSALFLKKHVKKN